MSSREFAYWLQGFFEIRAAATAAKALDNEQVAVIERHLALVFTHEIDPSYGGPKEQAKLNTIHQGNKPTGLLNPPHANPNNGIARC